MEMRKAAFAFAVSLSAAVPSFADPGCGPIGPRCNPDDQYRFFSLLHYGIYRQLADAGFNLFIDSHGSQWYRLGADRRKAGAERLRKFIEAIDRDGIDYMDRMKLGLCKSFRRDYPQINRDGSKNFGSIDFNVPECRNEADKIFRFTAEAFEGLPGFVGVQTSCEVRGASRPSFAPDYAAACRRDLGFDPPGEYVGQTAGGVALRRDFPVSRVVEPDYMPLRYYVWFWRKGDGWNGFQDACAETFRKTLGESLITSYAPILREPTMWGAGGARCRVGIQWWYATPEPYGVSYMVSELMATARGTPGMRVMPQIQAIATRRLIAPKNVKVADEPAWSRDRPNATYITQPPDLFREAMWMAFSRQVDGIGSYGWDSLVDAHALFGASKESDDYQFTNPGLYEVLKEDFLKAAVPLGPLLKAVPERAPEVAMLESHVSQLLGFGGAEYGWAYNYGDFAVAANLQPYVIYEEEIARDGIPPSVKVLLAPRCTAMLRTTFEAVKSFQEKGGIVASDMNLVPGLIADVLLPDYLLPYYDRARDGARDRKAIRKGVRQLRGDIAWAYAPYGDSENPDIVVHVRTYRNADYVFAVNDRRTFGDYVGQWRMIEEKGLPNEGTVTVKRQAGAVYDLVAHRAVPFANRDGKTEIPVSYTTTDGRILLVAPRPLSPLSVSVAADGEVEVTSPDRDVMVPIEVVCDGVKPRYGVVADGKWKRPYEAGANLRVRNLADGSVVRHSVGR